MGKQAPTHPIHNVGLDKVRSMIHYFYQAELASIKELLPKDEEPHDTE